jgi:hypothetical protein
MCTMVDLHNLQFPLLCQLSRSAPNILWSVGSKQLLQVGSDNPAVMAARISFKSLPANPVLEGPDRSAIGRGQRRREFRGSGDIAAAVNTSRGPTARAAELAERFRIISASSSTLIPA